MPDAITCLSYGGWNPASEIIHWGQSCQKLSKFCHFVMSTSLVWAWFSTVSFRNFTIGFIFSYLLLVSECCVCLFSVSHHPPYPDKIRCCSFVFSVTLNFFPISFTWGGRIHLIWKNTHPNPSLCHVSLKLQCKLPVCSKTVELVNWSKLWSWNSLLMWLLFSVLFMLAWVFVLFCFWYF